MARPGRKRKGPLQRLLDDEATQEAQGFLDVLTKAQRASGYYATGFDKKGKAEKHGRRHFRLTALDRLHKAGKISYEQHQAGSRYRELWDVSRYDHCRTMNLNEARGGLGTFDMPTRREDARDQFRAAQKEIQAKDVAFADGFLLKDEWAKLGEKARDRRLSRVRSVLSILAHHFKLIR